MIFGYSMSHDKRKKFCQEIMQKIMHLAWRVILGPFVFIKN